jgi:hypothetical protein
MVDDRMEGDSSPWSPSDYDSLRPTLTVRLCAAAVTGAFRVIDEDISRAVVIDEKQVAQSEALSLIDRAIREATNGRLGGPVDS